MIFITYLFLLVFSGFALAQEDNTIYDDLQHHRHQKVLNSTLSTIKQNRYDADTYFIYNNVLELEDEHEEVASKLKNYYPKLPDYYQHLYKKIYFQNKLSVQADIFKADNYKGTSFGLTSQHDYKNHNFGLALGQDTRNFNGDLVSANFYKFLYSYRFSYFSKYVAEFSVSPEDKFLPSFGLSQQYYFSLNKTNAAFVGLSNNFYKRNNNWFHTVSGGWEHYYRDFIFHANAFITLAPKDVLTAMQYGLTYNIDYRSAIKASYTFGESVDDANLFGVFQEYNLRYNIHVKSLNYIVFINHYDSNFRLENRLGGAVEWSY